MKYKTTLLVSSLLASAMMSAFGVEAQSTSPNIVLLFVDDLGQRDLGAYGSTFHESPNIDKLASEGVLFHSAYAAYSRCVPSRVGLMSGKYPSRLSNGPKGKHSLPLAEVTFGEALKESGYHTAYMGKWHLGKEGGYPSAQGFETTVHTGTPGAPKSYFYPFPMVNGAMIENTLTGKEGDYLTDSLGEEAAKYILNQKHSDKPFLLVFADYSVHTPFEAPEKTIEYFRQKLKKMGLAEGGKSGEEVDEDIVIDRESATKTLQNNPIYAAMIKHTDMAVGKIMQAVKDIGQEDNTVFIFSSDHGGLSSRGKTSKRPLATTNLPFRQGKGSIFEGGSRVPLIVKWPGVTKPGTVSPVQVTGVDHYPTMLEIAGVPLRPEQHIDGRSYVEALKGKNYQREGMFWYKFTARPHSTGDTPALAYVEGQYKIIDWWSEGFIELYDLKNDIGEQNDLSKTHPELAKRLLNKLHAKEEEIGNLRRGK